MAHAKVGVLVVSRPGVLLDRDGTIIVDYHYVGHIERVQLIPGAADAIARFNSTGIPVAIVTNQSGVARGFYPIENVHEVHAYIAKELALHGAHIDLFLYSSPHPDGNIKEYTQDSNRHKPNPGMAYEAANILHLDLHNSYVVGDRHEDMTMAGRIGAHAIHVGPDRLHKPPGSRPASFNYFPSLADAASFIIERITGMEQSEFPDMSYHSMISYWAHYRDEIRTITDRVNATDIARAADVLTKAYDNGSRVFAAGNGGAAALADHFECDHVNHMGKDPSWYTNIHSLTANIPMLTATANDIGYDAIFSYQLERQGLTGDVLIVFSVSGNSANIVRALQSAKEQCIKSIAVVASDGGKAAGMADVTVHIPTSNYGLAEDVMQMIMHSMAQYIRQTRMSNTAVRSARF